MARADRRMSPRPYTLYRDTGRAWLAGVCAGIADYLGVEPVVVRLATALGLIFFFIPTVAAYIVLAMGLKPRPPALFESPAEERFWRGVATAPADSLHELNGTFSRLDQRIGRMESLIASSEFELRRGFRDLGR